MSGISGEWQTVRTEAEQELEHRLALASSEDTMRGMFFRAVQDALVSLKGEEAAAAVCREECGGVRHFVDFFAYPTSDFLRMLRRAAWLMGGMAGSFEDSLRMMGYVGSVGFLGSLAGNAMEVLFSGTPRRVLENLPMAYKLMMPAGGGLSVAWRDYTSARVVFARDFLPRPYAEGSLEAQLKKAGARSLRITGRTTGALSSELDVTWEN